MAAFQEFLAREGKPTEILWLFREDVSTYKRNLWLRVPVDAGNQRAVCALYAQGLERGLGVVLNQIGECANQSLGYVWIPADTSEMEGAMMSRGQLKLSILQSRYALRTVTGGLRWTWLKWRNQGLGGNGLATQLPERKPILARLPAVAGEMPGVQL